MSAHDKAARVILCSAGWLEANDLFSREIVLAAALSALATRVERETRERDAEVADFHSAQAARAIRALSVEGDGRFVEIPKIGTPVRPLSGGSK